MGDAASFAAGEPVEEGGHALHDVGLIKFAGAVAAAVENLVFGVHAVPHQRFVKPLALRNGHQRVSKPDKRQMQSRISK